MLPIQLSTSGDLKICIRAAWSAPQDLHNIRAQNAVAFVERTPRIPAEGPASLRSRQSGKELSVLQLYVSDLSHSVVSSRDDPCIQSFRHGSHLGRTAVIFRHTLAMQPSTFAFPKATPPSRGACKSKRTLLCHFAVHFLWGAFVPQIWMQ